MNKVLTSLYLTFILLSCQPNAKSPTMDMYFNQTKPSKEPLTFLPGLILKNKIIHRGVFSPIEDKYYITISKKDFTEFEIKRVSFSNGKISHSQNAFFNSKYDDHGLSFSADGKTAYFSSTRPIKDSTLPPTWHLWSSKKENDGWSEAQYLEISNLKNKLLSHPTVTKDGKLYFHASNLDYSEMDLYAAELEDGKYQKAHKVMIPTLENTGKCTPYISPEGSFLIFATIGSGLDLYITHQTKNGRWSSPKRLSDAINSSGQANPVISPDGQFLFFCTGKETMEKPWAIKWVSAENL